MAPRGRLLPTAALLFAAITWGSTVVVGKNAYETMTPASVLVVRLVLAGVVLLLAFPGYLRMNKRTMAKGIILGLIFNTGLTLQMVGLDYTPPSLSGFITASYVVFTALISAVVLRTRLPNIAWLAVGMTIVGIAVLSTGHGEMDAEFGFGAGLTLLSAVAFASHIVLLGRWARSNTYRGLTLMQGLSGAVAALIVAPFVNVELPATAIDWAQVAFLGIVAGAVTLFLQSWAQSYVAPVASAIILCSEPVWGAVFAISFGFEPLTVAVIGGGLLVVSALVLTILPRRIDRRLPKLLADLRLRRRD
ncbi:MAG: EamA family transporter [Arachnia propionica]|nr:MAG: EamA family transporter [Arachnia propionica]